MTQNQLAALTPRTSVWSDVDSELKRWTYDCLSRCLKNVHWLRDYDGIPEKFSPAELLSDFHLTREDALRSLIARLETELTELKSQLPVGA